MSTDIESKMLKAKIELMTKSVFISTICLSVRHIITDSVPTAATNNTTIMYNPDFVAKLSVAELAGLIAHECWHIAYMHIVRRLNRDPEKWNIAGDHVINNVLVKAGFEIPDTDCCDPAYADMSTDEVYNALPPNPPMPQGMILDILGEPGGNGQTPEEAKSAITDVLVRAHTQAKIAGLKAGEIPGEILRVIDELLNPRLPWQTLLNRFLDQRVREEYSWARRNRRFTPYMPSMHSYGLGRITWGIDTSGSQDDDALKSTLSEIKSVQDIFHPESMVIIDCDSRIHNVYEIDADTDILSLKFNGGGGTRFSPVLDYVTEHPTQALIYFTDLYGEAIINPVDYPVLWVCNSDHPPSPIGETVYFN